MNIKVTKLTNVNLLHKANSFTTGKESFMSLKTAYRHGHSTIRTQLFSIEFTDIPLFVASHLVRHTAGVSWYQRSKRPDRGGLNFKEACWKLQEWINLLIHPSASNAEKRQIYSKVGSTLEGFPVFYDRNAPTNLFAVLNAEAIINISRKRLCLQASPETMMIWQQVCELVEEADPDLHPHLVRPCVATGVCREPNCCGYIGTQKYREQRHDYKDLFQ